MDLLTGLVGMKKWLKVGVGGWIVLSNPMLGALLNTLGVIFMMC